jgi:hypothetical protein
MPFYRLPGSGGADTAGVLRHPAEPSHLGLAQELVLPLPREEIVAEHHGFVLRLSLVVVDVSVARVRTQLSDRHDRGDDESSGDEKDVDHRISPFL